MLERPSLADPNKSPPLPVSNDAVDPKKLDGRELRFVDEYLVDLDVERAAVAAGYSESMAKSKAYQWVSNGKVKPHVFAAIRDRQLKLSNRLAITQERVLQELARIGFLDIRKAYDDSGKLKAVGDLDDDTAAAIAGLEVQVEKDRRSGETLTRTHKLKFVDKKGALDTLARHLGLLKEDQGRGSIDIFHYMAHDQKIIDRYNTKRAVEEQAPMIEQKPSPLGGIDGCIDGANP